MRRAKALMAKRARARRLLRAAERAAIAAIDEFGKRVSDMIVDRVFPQIKVARLQDENDRFRDALQKIASVHPDNSSSMCWVVKVAVEALQPSVADSK